MRPVEPTLARWRASLRLGFARRGAATRLVRRSHAGPLVVQKPLYPEGSSVCHAIVVHPPGGVAGGDALDIAIEAEAGAQALVTTPAAGKWYRSVGAPAQQRVSIRVAQGASLEWLPQETIVFDGAIAAMETDIRLAPGARAIGWEIVCLGRTGSGERFGRGVCALGTALAREDGTPLWVERARIEGGSPLLASPAGLAGAPVFGTLFAAFPGLGAAHVAACREHAPAAGDGAVTLLPEVLLARYVGASSEAARRWFARLWAALRPAALGREAHEPRIWRT
ncbi:MAG: urease accessory protein UreD [Burkholderiales bacterium]|nr:urease accessory protein UreD [Burkholderiales bacterium]